jgi:hypothetical protein
MPAAVLSEHASTGWGDSPCFKLRAQQVCCSVRPTRSVQPKQEAHPPRQVPPAWWGDGFSGFSQTGLVSAPGLVPAGALGLAGCPSSRPRLLLRDFGVEPIPPHLEERVLVHRRPISRQGR